MAKFIAEFGRPAEREHFINTHERFFERLGNLQAALHAAFVKVDARLEMVDIVVLSLGNLCVDDFSEILLLCANGFGNGALKILRGLYEKLVEARYLHMHPEEADAFWNFHAVKLSKMQLTEALKKIDPDGKILDRFKVAPKGGGRRRIQSSWTSKDFVSRANEVGLGEHDRTAYYLPLEFAHPSVQAILSNLEVKDGSLNVKTDVPQRETAVIALAAAHFLILEVLRLQIEHFGLDGDDPVFQRCLSDYVYAFGRDEAAGSKGT